MSHVLEAITKHPFFNTTANISLSLLYVYFLLRHSLAIKSGDISPIVIIFITMETLAVLLLMNRTDPVKRSTSAIAWTAAFSGTFIPLLLSPYGTPVSSIAGDILMMAGGILAIISYLSLNFSFGISPALRNVKTKGLYSLVRHPMYLSYFVLYTGYLGISFSPFNAAIVMAMFALLGLRIHYEEKLLMTSDDYRTYAEKVRFRMLPYIF